MALKPIKPSKAARNSRKREIKKLLDEQRRPQELPRRMEEVVYKRMG